MHKVRSINIGVLKDDIKDLKDARAEIEEAVTDVEAYIFANNLNDNELEQGLIRIEAGLSKLSMCILFMSMFTK